MAAPDFNNAARVCELCVAFTLRLSLRQKGCGAAVRVPLRPHHSAAIGAAALAFAFT
jgi:hypothetical protein